MAVWQSIHHKPRFIRENEGKPQVTIFHLIEGSLDFPLDLLSPEGLGVLQLIWTQIPWQAF